MSPRGLPESRLWRSESRAPTQPAQMSQAIAPCRPHRDHAELPDPAGIMAEGLARSRSARTRYGLRRCRAAPQSGTPVVAASEAV